MNDWDDQTTYYAFAAKGIQSYILRSYRLKEMIGASELVEGLSGKLLPQLLEALRCQIGQDYEFLTQAAGSARMLFKEKKTAREVAEIFPLLCEQYAPGLSVVQALCPVGADVTATIENAERLMAQARNRAYPRLPPASPLSKRCARTGLAATASEDAGKGIECLDAETLRKARTGGEAAQALIGRVAPAEHRRVANWGFDFDEIAAEGSYLAVLHADANSLGSIVQGLQEKLSRLDDPGKSKALYCRFSAAVQDATEAAARAAFLKLLPRWKNRAKYPLRPIVCAGDDLTVVIRAEDALDYASEFLASFETESRMRLESLGIGLDGGLTACAGIAFVKKHYPYWRAYELSESLCRYAKKRVNRAVSAVAFRRVTTSLGTDYEDGVLKSELTLAQEPGVLTMNPYRVGALKASGGGDLEALLSLCTAMEEMPRGSLRQVVSSMYRSRDEADRNFERALSVADEKSAPLVQAMQSLGCKDRTLWTASSPPQTPLLDAIELESVRTVLEGKS